MKTCDALDRLYIHQTAILDRIESATALLHGDPTGAQPELAKARWELTRKLRAYQIFKHTEIFDPALASGSPTHVAAAKRMKAECIAAGEAFRTYVLVWSSSDVIGSWPRYRPEMLAMARHLRDHIARERQQVADFLAGSERTRRLSAPRSGAA